MADDLDFSNLAKLPDGSLTQAEVRLLLSVVDDLRAEVRRLRDALNNRDAAWEARLQQAYDDGDLNCDPWDIWPSEADRG